MFSYSLPTGGVTKSRMTAVNIARKMSFTQNELKRSTATTVSPIPIGVYDLPKHLMKY